MLLFLLLLCFAPKTDFVITRKTNLTLRSNGKDIIPHVLSAHRKTACSSGSSILKPYSQPIVLMQSHQARCNWLLLFHDRCNPASQRIHVRSSFNFQFHAVASQQSTPRCRELDLIQDPALALQPRHLFDSKGSRSVKTIIKSEIQNALSRNPQRQHPKFLDENSGHHQRHRLRRKSIRTQRRTVPLHAQTASNLLCFESTLSNQPLANSSGSVLPLRLQRLPQLSLRNPTLRQHQQPKRNSVPMRSDCSRDQSISALAPQRSPNHRQHTSSAATPLFLEDRSPSTSPRPRPSARAFSISADAPLRHEPEHSTGARAL